MVMGGLSKRLEHENLLHICSLNVFIIHLVALCHPPHDAPCHLCCSSIMPHHPPIVVVEFFILLVVTSTLSSLFVHHAIKNNSIPMPLTLPYCSLTWCIPIMVHCQWHLVDPHYLPCHSPSSPIVLLFHLVIPTIINHIRLGCPQTKTPWILECKSFLQWC
jgi:hypothetical protein